MPTSTPVVAMPQHASTQGRKHAGTQSRANNMQHKTDASQAHSKTTQAPAIFCTILRFWSSWLNRGMSSDLFAPRCVSLQNGGAVGERQALTSSATLGSVFSSYACIVRLKFELCGHV